MLIPFVNFIVGIVLCIDLAKSFGKGAGFGIGLVFLGIIFLPILGFGSAQYQGAAAAEPNQGIAVPLPPPQSLEKRAEVDLRRFCCFRADFGTAEFPLSDKPRIALSLERSELDFAPAALRKLRISEIFH